MPKGLNGFVILLWFGTVLSALSVVYVTHATRRATQTLESIRQESAALHVESGQYLLEKSSLSSHARVERLAIEKLNMTMPQSAEVLVISSAVSVSTPAGGSGSESSSQGE